MTIQEIRARRRKVLEEAKALHDAAERENRKLTTDEDRRFHELVAEARGLGAQVEGGVDEALRKLDQSAGTSADSDLEVEQSRDSAEAVTRETVVLEPEQRMHDWAVAQGYSARQVSLEQVVRGLAFGAWDSAVEDVVAASRQEHRDFGSQVGLDGGYLVPIGTAAEVLDLARSRMRVIEAGARRVPMPAAEYTVPRLEKDPTPAWRREGEQFNPSAGEIGGVKLVAKGLGVLTKIPLELVQDAETDAEQMVTRSITAAIGLELDRVALFGDGDAGEPVGLVETKGVPTTSLAAAPSSWDFVVDRVGDVEDSNYTVSAGITSPRVGRQFAKLKTGISGDNRALPRPEKIQQLRILETTQVRVNLGTGENESLMVVGDFGQLLLGQRLEIAIQVLRERFADEGKIGVIAWTRVDVGVARTNAFSIEDQITDA